MDPPQTYPRQDAVLAVHLHPEFVPFDVIRGRIKNTFPNKTDELIIPTQHNILTSYDAYTGVEVDCYSPKFNRKVQLLLHFERSRLEGEQTGRRHPQPPHGAGESIDPSTDMIRQAWKFATRYSTASSKRRRGWR